MVFSWSLFQGTDGSLIHNALSTPVLSREKCSDQCPVTATLMGKCEQLGGPGGLGDMATNYGNKGMHMTDYNKDTSSQIQAKYLSDFNFPY